MLVYKVFLGVLVAAAVITECYTIRFSEPISIGTVNGYKIKFCEYKLTKMLPKSRIHDAEACLTCSCNKKSLKCKDYDKIPGCKLMPGGLLTQNPFDEKWIVMIDKLIKSMYVGKYRVLQVRTQTVTGGWTNVYLKLLVIDRLCDLKIFDPLNGFPEITEDPCSLGKEKCSKCK